MRGLAIVLLVIVVPALAAEPPPARQAPEAKSPPVNQSPPPAGRMPPNGASIEEFQAYLDGLPAAEREAILKNMRFASRPGSTCYYIHQINQNLQKPKEKPELVLLASASAVPIRNSNPDCLPDAIVRKAVDR
jgi:hypothetical protein